jgi:hypothetical protein
MSETYTEYCSTNFNSVTIWREGVLSNQKVLHENDFVETNNLTEQKVGVNTVNKEIRQNKE